MNSDRCQASRSMSCRNKPWRIIDVTWNGRRLVSYWFCRKHYAGLVADGRTR